MAELNTTRLLNLEVSGQHWEFNVTGYSVGTIQLVTDSGSWVGASVDILRGNEAGSMVALESPVSLTADGMTPTLDITSKFIGVKVATPGGPGIVKVIIRCINT